MIKTLVTAAAGAALAFTLATAPARADGMAAKGYSAAPAAGCSNRFGGAYIGAHVGSGSMTSTLTQRDSLSFFGTDSSQTKDAMVFGGQIGYNWQRCGVVFGVEADLTMGDLDTSRTYYAFFGLPVGLNRSVDWIGSVRTKSGVVVGDLFIYATGGIAFANMSTKSDVFGYSTFKMDDTRIGWVAGIGTEYAINDRMSITGDVLYYDFGTEHAVSDLTYISYDDRSTMWVSRIGLNFKLGSREAAYEPMK